MATQEITISELELADEILGDMNIPVDTATETRAVTLKQLRAWLGSALPIGSIFASVGKLDDARYTLLDGKTISRTGTYEAFCNKVVSEVQAGRWTACSEDEFNLEVSETGQCGKFVVSNDYVRIPKLGNSLCSGVIDGTIPVVGNGKALGITNGTTVGDLINGGGDTYNRVGLHLSSKLTNATLPQSNANIKSDYSGLSIGVVQDEQTSGLVGKINSVQVYYYMVVSTEGQTAEIEVDINKVYEDMELKANTSLSNLTGEGRSLASGFGMPSGRYDELTLGATGTNYTAPANGYFYIDKQAGVNGAFLYLSNNTAKIGAEYAITNASSNHCRVYVPAKKGDIVNISYNVTGTTNVFIFVYAEGEN